MNYKNTFLLLVSFFLFSGFQMIAQTINYGIKAGVNYSNFKTSNTGRLDFNYRYLYQGGVYAEIPIHEQFTLQPELLYSAQGSKAVLDESDFIGGPNPMDPVISGNDSRLDYSLNYLLLPVMINYNFYKGFFIGAGPQMGYLISAERELHDNAVTYLSNDNFKDSFKDFTFDFNFGLGYKFKNGLHFNFRYSLGLNDIDKSDGVKYSNSVFQFSVGYLIFKK